MKVAFVYDGSHKDQHFSRIMEYIFFLGKNPVLSQAELRSLFPSSEIMEERDLYVSIRTSKRIDQGFLNMLGGTVKIGHVMQEPPLEYLARLSRETPGKLSFGLTLLDPRTGNIKKLLMEWKRKLKQQGVSARFINKNFENVTTVQIHKEHLVKSLTDITLLPHEGRLKATATVGVQDFENYSYRDYEKPFRDARMGMLPPKLAQIMINLCGQKRENIYDPFCGSGTIAMEALLQNLNVLASDIAPACVNGTKQNLEWLRRTFDIAASPSSETFQHDAREPFRLPHGTWHIVTEGYLGPPQRTAPAPEIQKRIFGELDELYQRFFSHAAQAQTAGSRICIAFPFFPGKDGGSYPFMNKYAALGYTILRPHPKPLLYVRPNQRVGREIVLFERA